MTKKAIKVLLSIQAKATASFIAVYALVMAILLTVFSFTNTLDTLSIWMSDSIMYTINIYLLIMGIVYPLTSTKLFVSRGMTREQFYWALTGAMSIISLGLLIPIFTSAIYFGHNLSLPSALTHYLYLPLYFLIGWTSVVGFQMRKWYTATLGVLSAIVMFYAIMMVTDILALSDLAILGSVLLLLGAVLLILPRVISRIPLKS